MKKVFKSVVVVIAVLFSYGIASAQQKIGHIDSGDILSVMPEMKTAQESLNTFIGTKTTEAQGMQAELQKKYTAYLDKQKNLSEANREVLGREMQTLETEMNEMQGRLQEYNQMAEQQIGEKQQELMQPVFTKLTATINTVAKEKGYAYVLDVSQQRTSVIFFDGGDDLTADVRTKLGIAADAKPIEVTPPANN